MKTTARSISKTLIVLGIFLISCGEEFPSATTTDQQIFITGFSFVPGEITASAGETIFFYNDDPQRHRVLSQSAVDAFDNTGVFDTFLMDPGTGGSITIPDTALPGDEFFYYDDIFKENMTTPTGIIRIE